MPDKIRVGGKGFQCSEYMYMYCVLYDQLGGIDSPCSCSDPIPCSRYPQRRISCLSLSCRPVLARMTAGRNLVDFALFCSCQQDKRQKKGVGKEPLEEPDEMKKSIDDLISFLKRFPNHIILLSKKSTWRFLLMGGKDFQWPSSRFSLLSAPGSLWY